MPFSKNPMMSTYTTERIDFVYNSQARSALDPTKDSRFLNMMVEGIVSPNSRNNRIFIKSRPGLTSAFTLTAGTPRGVYYWVYNGLNYVVTVVGSDVKINGVTQQTLTTTTGTVGFTEHVSSIGVVSLVMVDGIKGYVFANPTSAPTLITDVNFPSPHIPTPVFLDAYIFLAKAGTGDIYNSALDIPTSWSDSGGAAMFISAEMYPDTIQVIAKNNNYIYAFGNISLEYFYDAANVTSSPLARQDSASKSFGTISPTALSQTETEIVLIGNTGIGNSSVWVITGFKEKEIATPAVQSILAAEGANLPLSVGYCIRVASQKFYILRLTSRTLVYSFTTELWTEWASGVDNITNFVGAYGADGPNGTPYILASNGANVALMSESYFTDLGTAIYCSVITPKYDFDSLNRKFMSRLSLVGDVPISTGTDNIFSISWSDDDYTTWVPDRQLTFNNDFSSITQLGQFRRRAFRVNYSSPHLIRLDGIEVDINKGSQ